MLRHTSWLLPGAVSLLILFGTTLSAADHNDAPLIRPLDPVDINDIYAFQSPSNSDNIVLIMTTNPDAGVGNDGTLDPRAKYEFLVDTNGDAVADITYSLRASLPNRQGQQRLQLARNHRIIANGRTDQNIRVRGGGTLRVSIQDDPFFFDAGVLVGGDGGNDSFAGMNVTAITLELPSQDLMVANIGVWARTTIGTIQVDRMGRPAINTLLIASKDRFNGGEPVNDPRDFGTEMEVAIVTLNGGDRVTAAALTSFLLPDILTIDTSDTTGFINGRRLEDDVIDAELYLFTNGAVTGDGVDRNDRTFSNTFPYLASPNVWP